MQKFIEKSNQKNANSKMTDANKERIALLEWFMEEAYIGYVAPGKYEITYEDGTQEFLNHDDILKLYGEHKEKNKSKVLEQ